MIDFTKRNAILVLAGTLLAGDSAFASAPFYVPLGAMVAEAEAVAVVRIEKIEEIPRPQGLPHVWYPNRTFTVRPTDVVRGTLPESFTIRAGVDRHTNPSAKAGAAALVFLSATKAGPDGDLPAYEAAQGVRVIADLIPDGDEKAQAAARDALVAAVKASRPTSQHGRLWDPSLTDAAMGPLLKLLESADPLVRRWVLARGLDYVHVTPDLGERLVALLEDKDAEVAATAALTLAHKNQRSSAAALQAYRKRIPAGKAFEYRANEVRGTLQYWKVLGRVDAMPGALAGRVAAVVTDRHTRVVPVSLDLRLDKDGVRLEQPSGAVFSDAVLRDLRERFEGLPAELETLPLRVTLYVYRDNGVVTWGGDWHR